MSIAFSAELFILTSPVPAAPGVRAAWIGHATCLLQMAGVTFLTDPIFSERASPFQRLGPRQVHHCF